MDLNALREKMVPNHVGILRRMLSLNELPEPVVLRYFAIKKVMDKIDGFLSPSDLLRIALDCGLNLDTMRFEKPKETVKTVVKEVVKEVVKVIQPEPTVVVDDLGDDTASEDISMEDTVLMEDDEPEPEPEPRQDIDIAGAIAKGTTVTAFYDGDVVSGVIQNSRKEDGIIIYSVDIEDEVVDFGEDEIEEG